MAILLCSFLSIYKAPGNIASPVEIHRHNAATFNFAFNTAGKSDVIPADYLFPRKRIVRLMGRPSHLPRLEVLRVVLLVTPLEIVCCAPPSEYSPPYFGIDNRVASTIYSSCGHLQFHSLKWRSRCMSDLELRLSRAVGILHQKLT